MSSKEGIEGNLKEICERCVHYNPAVLEMEPNSDRKYIVYHAQIVNVSKYIDQNEPVIRHIGALNIYRGALKKILTENGYKEVEIETKFKGGHALFLVFWGEEKNEK